MQKIQSMPCGSADHRADLRGTFISEIRERGGDPGGRRAGGTEFYMGSGNCGMSAKSETLYLKIDQNTIVTDRHVTLGDIAKMECPDASIVRQLKQKKIYTFAEAMNPRKQKNQMKVFSILKIVELIHEEYPNVEVGWGRLCLAESIPYGIS